MNKVSKDVVMKSIKQGAWEAYLRIRASLKLCLEGPGHWRSAISGKNGVDSCSVHVLSVDEEAVHIEQACLDRR